MTKTTIAGGTFVAGLVLVALVAGYRWLERGDPPVSAPSFAVARSPAGAEEEDARGFLYGRVTTVGGIIYEGRLRWAQTQEAFWDDLFNGVRHANPWAAHVPPARRQRERRTIEIFGFAIGEREPSLDLRRPFMVRFGDLARLEADGVQVRATLKSGTVVDLDRLEAGDFDDGVRVWDRRRGVVDLEPWQIRAIDFLPTPRLAGAPTRLHGTVRTRQGDLTGFVAWDRDDSVGSDELEGRTAEGAVTLRFDSLRALARRSERGLEATLADGRTLVLSARREGGLGRRGISVDDPHFGRAMVSWNAFERVDFSDLDERIAASGPAYDDFAPGHPLSGRVTTRTGTSLAGRLVFDLDESETTETLDAPSHGIDYVLPFGLVAAIEPPGRDEPGARRVRVTFHHGGELQLEPSGDLGKSNGGLLVFVDGGDRGDLSDSSGRVEYIPWSDVARIDLDPPLAPGPAPGPPPGPTPGGG